MREFWEKWGAILSGASTVALLTILLRFTGFLQILELTALDKFFQWRPGQIQDSRILIVNLNESDFHHLGTWPISDEKLAKLIEIIKSQNPRLIGLDIVRDLPVEPGHKKLLEVYRNTPNLIGIKKVVKNAYGDRVSSPPILGDMGQVGAANIVLDYDGKVRRALLAITLADGQTIYSFSVKLALMYLEQEGIELIEIDPDNFEYGLGKARFSRLTPNAGGYVNADTGGYQILFNIPRPACPPPVSDCRLFPAISMSDLLQGKIPPDLMRDRIVLIGYDAESLRDYFFTSYSHSIRSRLSGVEIHGALISQLLSAAIDGYPLIKFWAEPIEWLWILLWSFIGAIFSWTLLRIRVKVFSFFLMGFGLTLGCYGAFLAGWWLPLVPPLVAMGSSGIVITAYIAFIASQDKQTVMNLFERHVTPKIAQSVWRDRHELLTKGKLLGRKMTATVLFTDLKGFTSVSEQTDPETLMLWLNDYMNAMADIVLEYDGVIDKFIGDAVMAVFGVPIPSTTPEAIAADAKAAVACAIAMAQKLQIKNQQWQQQGLPTVAMRVGIATGTVVAGSLGSHKRIDYTIIGDSVNVASRLESYDKSMEGGVCRILINEETYQYIQHQFPTKFIAQGVQLKGRQQPVNIYQVLLENVIN